MQAPAKPKTQRETRSEPLGMWHVVLHDSPEHTYEYVIDMAAEVLAMPLHRGFHLAKEVDTRGRGICLTTHRELAELKAEQIRGFGPDIRIASCSRPMSVTLEPACNNDGEGKP